VTFVDAHDSVPIWPHATGEGPAGHSWGADLSLMCALAVPEGWAGLLCLAGGRLNNDQRPTLFRDVAALTMPALFLYGGDDVRSSWPVEQIAALMPHGRFVPGGGVGHYLYLTHPGAAHQHSSAFLGGLES
jgi:proline iminopeptidase